MRRILHVLPHLTASGSTPWAVLLVGSGLLMGGTALVHPPQTDAASDAASPAAPTAPAPVTTPQGDFLFALPGKSWGVSLGFSGFTLSSDDTTPDGRRSAMASHPTTHVNVSATLEQTDKPASSAGCIAHLEQLKASPLAAQGREIRLTTTSTLPTLEYTIPELRGIPLAQRHVHLCYPKENVYLDLHLSKVQYRPADDELFRAFLQTVHIQAVPPGASASAKPATIPTPPPAAAPAPRTSAELFAAGSQLYLQKQYQGAIAFYQQALDLERANPQLDRIAWRILIDNLGMAYGISGKLDRAKRTFEYGIAEDHTYPMFHYNLACTFAELNDRDKAMQALRTAFRYRVHRNPGEAGVPDPRRDHSFQQLLKHADFRRFVDQLMAQYGS